MSAKGEALRTYIKAIIDNRRLIELTNDTVASGTTINDDRLLEICDTALGQFRWRSGHEPDTSLYAHLGVLQDGVLWLLHQSKLKSASVATEFKKEFVLACNLFREHSIVDPLSSSKTTRTPERVGSRPDMDINNIALRGTRLRASVPTDINE